MLSLFVQRRRRLRMVPRARRFIPALLLLGATSVAFALPALAGDGIIEIDGIRAAVGSINNDPVSDPPGYPVTITQPGSYRLTSNLGVEANKTGIHILADDVSLDLGGFAVFGTTICGGQPVICVGPTAGAGVLVEAQNASITNGTIGGIGADGVAHVEGAPQQTGIILRDLFLLWNSDRGVDLRNPLALLSNVRSILNGNDGMAIPPTSTTWGLTAEGNGGDGVHMVIGGGVVVQQLHTRANTLNGLRREAGGSVLRTIESASNIEGGISVRSDSIVSMSTASKNKDGIVVLDGNTLIVESSGVGSIQSDMLAQGGTLLLRNTMLDGWPTVNGLHCQSGVCATGGNRVEGGVGLGGTGVNIKVECDHTGVAAVCP
jgi:hypothetical protein